MILELRLSNLFSLRDEASLNLQAAKIQTEKGRALQGNLFTVGGEQFLKSVAVFGANASGKSTGFSAVQFTRSLDVECPQVIFSQVEPYGFH